MSKDTNQAANNIDQIRDLIFGPQMAEYERKFGELEKTVQTMNTDIQKALDSLKNSLEDFRKESEQARLAMHKELKQDNERLRAQLEETSGRLEQQMEQIGDASAGRQQLADYLEEMARRLRQAEETDTLNETNQTAEND